MLTIRGMSDGKGYSVRHLEHNDYYAEGERAVGQWCGRGAELLGLSGAVHGEDFEAVRQGLDPKSKEFLRVRKSADRAAADGTKLAQGRSLYDFTISAPKSVSVMAILGEDRRLMDAHRTAVAEALHETEAFASSRIRQSGANTDRVTANLVLAVYHHDTSRELDPQIHTHAVAANLTFDGTEDRWKALQASDIYERRAYLSEVYRNALAREVRALGYEIDPRPNSGFEIKGLPNELLDKFSQRSRQRDRAIEEFVAENGRQPSNNEVAVLVRESRAAKLIEISSIELTERQRSRLTATDERALSDSRSWISRRPQTESAEPSLQYAKDHVFERVSVAEDHEILAEALRHGRGRIRLADLKGELGVQMSDGRVLRNGTEIATRESLERERCMIAAVNLGIGSFEPLGCEDQFVGSDRLRPEQKQAVEFVLQSRDRAVGISGAAGTGKTATLQELRRALIENGREVLAVAPTMSAVAELQKVGFSDAITLARLIQDTRLQAELNRRVVILDEAGLVSAGQMSEFLRLAEQRDFRVVFSGDSKQIQSVEAGDALRILEKESRLKSVSLTQVQRQTHKDYRDAIQELRKNPERGFAKLDSIGAVREVQLMERAKAVAAAYTERPDSLVVCATHDEIARVTEAIRDGRKNRTELGVATVLSCDVSLNWTAAQKADFQNFRPGMILGFHRTVKGISKNESVEVVRADGRGIVVRNASGKENRITSKQAKSFDVLEARPIEISPGDRLLLTANRRDPGLRLTNGEIVTVAALEPTGQIQLEDGRSLPGNYRSIAHGYAVTAHRSQGKSVDSVIISADGMQKELFYVAASRGRQSIVVITSDKDRLKETVGQSMARKSASELVRGSQRGLSMARELLCRAAAFIAERIVPRKERTRERGMSR
jgi:conjugative relaxase-like TrwC/TraI family protein